MKQLQGLLKKHWGYDSFRPLQEEAMACVMAQRDSVVVLPTGGGKSLCFQAPAMAMPGLAVVVSPLISLMKDQVDALTGCGVPAAFINSTQSSDERRATIDQIRHGELKLLYVAPERLTASGFVDFLKSVTVSFFAVDEAHCISMWGHDFRKDYRELKLLKAAFPGLAVHGYTATATEQVRADIASQLQLRDACILVGSFDRPNLIYRVDRRTSCEWDQNREVVGHHRQESRITNSITRKNVDNLGETIVQYGYRVRPYHGGMEGAARKQNHGAFLRVDQRADPGWDQIRAVVDRHRKESGIIYCISRKNVDNLCETLVQHGYRALPYHAGMEDADRKKNQEAFLHEQVDIIVATVAFGMGIDKSNVRYVIHAGVPKSIEHYQQESGRAGRDGLEAECVLLFSLGDLSVWRRLLKDLPAEAHATAMKKLSQMGDYCTSVTCRHKSLVNYFGQELPKDTCGACDVCLDETDSLPNALITAQKILSCVVRLEERYGADYTALVLIGADDPRIRERGHDKLKTLGALSSAKQQHVRAWIDQLVSQECLKRSEEFRTLSLTPRGWMVIKGQERPRLSLPAATRTSHMRRVRIAADPWEGVDRDLFENLRALRRQIADEKEVPAFIVLSDATLRDLARRRPSTWDGLLDVAGIGERKRADYGERFRACITAHCRAHSIPMDVVPSNRTETPLRTTGAHSTSRGGATLLAFELFGRGGSIDDVAVGIGRSRRTTLEYLGEYLETYRIKLPNPWLDAGTFARIRTAAAQTGIERLKPIFDSLGGAVDYDLIRIGVACLRNQARAGDRVNDPSAR